MFWGEGFEKKKKIVTDKGKNGRSPFSYLTKDFFPPRRGRGKGGVGGRKKKFKKGILNRGCMVIFFFKKETEEKEKEKIFFFWKPVIAFLSPQTRDFLAGGVLQKGKK